MKLIFQLDLEFAEELSEDTIDTLWMILEDAIKETLLISSEELPELVTTYPSLDRIIIQ